MSADYEEGSVAHFRAADEARQANPLQLLHDNAGCCKPEEHEVFPCPECEQGKHGNCDGTTWDDLLDQPAPCPCFCVETDDEP